ncbi:MAG: DJ-1/PfpI family protein [Desulfovibrionales bacterium]|nr:DJ-1/PfpI family protein [Desulfovibrionales bacterium]
MEIIKKVLVPLAQGIEEMEAVTLIDVLRRANAHVVTASVDKGTIQASRGLVFEADTSIDHCLDQEFDLIVLPGGIPGAENLAASAPLGKMLKDQASQNRYYGAICASPAVVLHPLGLVRPGKVTCHPAFAHLIGEVSSAPVVRDGMCMTSRGGGTALDFALAWVELLFPPRVLDQVRGGLALD